MNPNQFSPDYRNILDVLSNRRPVRLPLYEHAIDPPFIRKVIGKDLAIEGNSALGFGLGSGNSIAGYIPVDGFAAMIDAAKKIREVPPPGPLLRKEGVAPRQRT
ncbi:MAG: hypothetical protein D4R64_19010 [Porphyromonadaceae bacterium]|nr:MAG: hypothetical protein D4R64_19010 [Porphyromonadaceae bacterium]